MGTDVGGGEDILIVRDNGAAPAPATGKAPVTGNGAAPAPAPVAAREWVAEDPNRRAESTLCIFLTEGVWKYVARVDVKPL